MKLQFANELVRNQNGTDNQYVKVIPGEIPGTAAICLAVDALPILFKMLTKHGYLLADNGKELHFDECQYPWESRIVQLHGQEYIIFS